MVGNCSIYMDAWLITVGVTSGQQTISLWGRFGVKWCGTHMVGNASDQYNMFYVSTDARIGLPNGHTIDPSYANENITVDTYYSSTTKRDAIFQLKVIYDGRSLPYVVAEYDNLIY